MSLRVSLASRSPLPSVGLICICGKPVATIEGHARACECGRVWLVSAMLISPGSAEKHSSQSDPS